jgi:hypothetical protein
MFEVAMSDGNIVLKAQDIVSRKRGPTAKTKKGVDIAQWISSGKWLFNSPEEAVIFTDSERI